jgi:glutaredoxin 3
MEETMARIEIYSKPWCGYCIRAKTLLDTKGVPYTDIDVAADRNKKLEMLQRSGALTVPQIFIDGRPIGGHDDLFALEAKGALDRILGRSASSETLPA